jgi:CBS-domain-containing membrane protein
MLALPKIVVSTLRLGWSLVGSVIGIGLALMLVAPPISPFLLASLGGSAVFLFALTNAPAAQPRALIGGHIGGALIGVLCYQWLGDALWVYVLAQVLTLLFMLLAHTMHPPAGANPLIMIQAQADMSVLLSTVLIGVLSLFVVAVLWSRVFKRSHVYPVAWLQKSPPQRFSGVWQDDY